MTRKSIFRVALLLALVLAISAGLMMVFGGNNPQSLEDRLASMNVTTITTRVTRNQTIQSGDAIVITGAGRVEADITVMPGGLLVVDGQPGALRGGVNAFRGRIFLRGGDFYLLEGALWHEAIGNNPTHPLVAIENGSTFTMQGGLIRSRSTTAANGTFGVSVLNGTFNMEGGTIFGSSHAQSPAVRVAPGNNTFTMTGGLLQMCNNSSSVGARVDGGTFYMYGGFIRNPGKHYRGTGVLVGGSGSFVMNGGEIYYNDTGVDVAGINASFIMNGGIVRDNVSKAGAGVDVSRGASFTMNDGYITHNRATSTGRGNGGGGVRVSDAGTVFVMHGGTIQHNRAPLGLNGHGGGVSVRESARFYMYDGLIDSNQAGSGGGVHVTNNSRQYTYMRLNGGTISNNEATKGKMSHGGGGVNVYAHKGSASTFDMYGGYIIDNRSSSRGGGSGMHGVGGGGVAIGTNNTKGERADIRAVATFNLHDGVIANNLAECDRTKRKTDKNVGGGGVYVYRRGSFFNMHGGVIEHNASVAGGGVGLWNTAEFNMYAGYIRNNEAFGGYFARTKRKNSNVFDLEIRGGGGVYLHNQSVKSIAGHRPTFNMHGGSIINNTSPEGGGIFWMSILDKATRHTEAHLRNYQIRESTLTLVYISQDAVVRNNIATNGTRVCDDLWGRHRAENPTVTWGGHVVTRSVPAPGGGQFPHLFNNHDILTWGQGNTPTPTLPYNVVFVNTPQGYFNGTLGENVTLQMAYEDVVEAEMVPDVDVIWGWEFVGWAYDAQGLNPADPEGHVVAGDINFYAQFQRRYFRATFATDGNGSLVDATFYIDVPFEGVVTLDMMPDVVPNPGFILSSWTPDPVNGHVMLDDVLFVASFVMTHVTFTFNVSPDYAGLVNWDVQHSIPVQVDVPFTAVPEVIILEPDYMFLEWSPFDPAGYTPTTAVGDRTFTAILVPRP